MVSVNKVETDALPCLGILFLYYFMKKELNRLNQSLIYKYP